MPEEDAERTRLIREADARRDFVTGEDGFVIYWPTRIGGGALDARVLRWLADELDRRNAKWAAIVEKELGPSLPTDDGSIE